MTVNYINWDPPRQDLVDMGFSEALDKIHPYAAVLWDRDCCAEADEFPVIVYKNNRSYTRDLTPPERLVTLEYGEVILNHGNGFWRLIETFDHRVLWLRIKGRNDCLGEQFCAFYGRLFKGR